MPIPVSLQRDGKDEFASLLLRLREVHEQDLRACTLALQEKLEHVESRLAAASEGGELWLQDGTAGNGWDGLGRRKVSFAKDAGPRPSPQLAHLSVPADTESEITFKSVTLNGHDHAVQKGISGPQVLRKHDTHGPQPPRVLNHAEYEEPPCEPELADVITEEHVVKDELLMQALSPEATALQTSEANDSAREIREGTGSREGAGSREGTGSEGKDSEGNDRREYGSQKKSAVMHGGILGEIPDERELDKTVYDVSDFYFDRGVAQLIAKSDYFQNITLGVIAANAVYIGVDADHNDPSSADPEIGFIICDQLFCIFFTFEWLVRFLAFRYKRNCLRDMWFKFDTGLVALMVFETWIATAFMGSGGGGGSATGMIKLLRLLRLARMARLMRAFPELMAMIKGLKVASRAVSSALMMLVLLVYVFAIIMYMLLSDVPDVDDEHHNLIRIRFESVMMVMWTLIVDATFLDGIGVCSRAILETKNYLAFVVLLIFVLGSAMTVMNMLIGVLCEVVTAVAEAEKEDAAIRLVKETVLVMLTTLDEDGSGEISKDEMYTVFNDDSALAVLETLKVDVKHLVDHLDMYYEENDDLSIPQIMDLILMLRGDRVPTMKDILHEQSFSRWKMANTIVGIADERQATEGEEEIVEGADVSPADALKRVTRRKESFFF
eukprot:TRINITY_DN35691_c0_g1_i1.p1 TRINITY_DN35691_c0_g1~~TRINITY_DN35691_c0_g1_i1.p1  ORF type:complete len:667 (-),score=154.21 TRINITY_DN35691_c0_g1_i1:160-2160(-)